MSLSRSATIGTLLMIAALAGAAEPARPLLHPLFGGSAVLQRGKPARLWGWSGARAEVTVTLAGPGLQLDPVRTIAAADGRWEACLPVLPAGGPYTLAVASDGRSCESPDVLVGDVWLCSGQSNMGMLVRDARDFEGERSQASFPRLRHLTVGRNNDGHPQELIQGRWLATTPETVGGFSATAYFFGRRLHQDLQVPIGLVTSAWGGTTCEAWTSAEALRSLPGQAAAVDVFDRLVRQVEAQQTATGKDYQQLIGDWFSANDAGSGTIPGWADPACDDRTWATASLPGSFADTTAGIRWVRRTFTWPADAAGREALLTLGRIDAHDSAFINGRRVGGSAEDGFTNRRFARRYHLPAGLLTTGPNTIAVRILGHPGSGGFAGPAAHLAITPDGLPAIPLAGIWRTRLGGAPTSPLPLRHDDVQHPTSLFNGMVHPLIGLSMTGVIWYQGESNAARASQYRSLLAAMITDWRTRLGQGDLPFCSVQLANHGERTPDPAESPWAELREAQAKIGQDLPAYGLAVAIDIGESWDIHPRNKQEVGRRLGLVAEALAYGKAVESRGPSFRSQRIAGSVVHLDFDHLGGGLTTSDGRPVTGFAISGADHRFAWASAVIVGDGIELRSPAVPEPVAVRYAWADNPDCNLVNRSGLPALPFRTDR